MFLMPNLGLARLDYRIKWDRDLKKYLKKLDAQKPVIASGDFNVAHHEIDLARPKANRGSAGFSDEERAEFNKLLEAGFIDTFRHFHPNQSQKYSWWSYRAGARQNNVGWRIDYHLTSDDLINHTLEASILDQQMGSDHAPISLKVDMKGKFR